MNRSSSRSNTNWQVILTITIILLSLTPVTRRISINALIFFDHLLRIGQLMSPILAWSIFGFVVGLMYGGWVTWKKYRLDFRLALIPVGFCITFLSLLSLANAPFKVEYHRPITKYVQQDAYSLTEVAVASCLPPYGEITYQGFNLVDQNDLTAWIENAKDAGNGQSISFLFPLSLNIQQYKYLRCIGFKIKNGYVKSQKLWAHHNRVRSFGVYQNDVLITQLSVSDRYNQVEQLRINALEIQPGDRITLVINSVYYGSRKKDQTAISHLIPIVEYAEDYR